MQHKHIVLKRLTAAALLVALGRGALAALPAALYLGWVRSRRPSRAEWPWLMGVVLGGVMVFPACMGWAVRQVPAWHASVITGVLPLLTAVLASGWLGATTIRVRIGLSTSILRPLRS